MSSSILSRPFRLWSAMAERIRTGISSIPNLNSTGTVAPAGSDELIRSSLSLISLQASSMSVPYSNSSTTTDVFSLDLDVMSFRFATLFKVFSRSFVRLFSTSEALAPG